MICLKSRSRDAQGLERVSRGCVKNNDHLPLYCAQSSLKNGHKKRDATAGTSSNYFIECCTGDFCNNGSFPYLSPRKDEIDFGSGARDPLKLTAFVFGSIFIVMTIASIVIFLMRRSNKRRLSESRLQQDDAFFATEDLLKRSHACGDSTLRVSIFSLHSIQFLFIHCFQINRNILINL